MKSALELTARQSNMTIEIHPNLPEIYRRKVADLQLILEDETTRPQAVETIRSLIDRIEIRPGSQRGRCEVVVVGALAEILAFVQERTSNTQVSGTFLVVAGACITRYRIERVSAPEKITFKLAP